MILASQLSDPHPQLRFNSPSIIQSAPDAALNALSDLIPMRFVFATGASPLLDLISAGFALARAIDQGRKLV
jgi:hypothetical protein